MLNFARLREALCDDRATYASKVLIWLGQALILDRKSFGLPSDFWDDQEDRAVLKGSEVDDPNFQRLQVRTDDFRRYLTYGVGRFMPYAIPVLAAPLLIAGYLAIVVLGPRSVKADVEPGVVAESTVDQAPSAMTDEQIVGSMHRMNAAGKTEQTVMVKSGRLSPRLVAAD